MFKEKNNKQWFTGVVMYIEITCIIAAHRKGERNGSILFKDFNKSSGIIFESKQ